MQESLNVDTGTLHGDVIMVGDAVDLQRVVKMKEEAERRANTSGFGEDVARPKPRPSLEEAIPLDSSIKSEMKQFLSHTSKNERKSEIRKFKVQYKLIDDETRSDDGSAMRMRMVDDIGSPIAAVKKSKSKFDFSSQLKKLQSSISKKTRKRPKTPNSSMSNRSGSKSMPLIQNL